MFGIGCLNNRNHSMAAVALRENFRHGPSIGDGQRSIETVLDLRLVIDAEEIVDGGREVAS